MLKNLKLAAALPVNTADPVHRGRAKLLAFLDEQKALAAAEVEGRSYAATRVVFRTNDQGQRIRAEAPRHVKRSWSNDAAGQLLFQIRYGSKPLELRKGFNAVVVPRREDLPLVIDALATAVLSGDLDAAVSKAAAERRVNFKRRDGKPASVR